MSTKISKKAFIEALRNMIRKEIEEVSTSAATPGYMTPNAFSGKGSMDRRNSIARLLEEWGLLKVISNNHTDPIAPMSQIKVLPHKEKHEWELIPKYNIGVVNK